MTSKLPSCPKVKSFPLLSCFIYSLGSIYLFYHLPSSLDVVPTPKSLQLRIGHMGSFKNLRSGRTVYITNIYTNRVYNTIPGLSTQAGRSAPLQVYYRSTGCKNGISMGHFSRVGHRLVTLPGDMIGKRRYTGIIALRYPLPALTFLSLTRLKGIFGGRHIFISIFWRPSWYSNFGSWEFQPKS